MPRHLQSIIDSYDLTVALGFCRLWADAGKVPVQNDQTATSFRPGRTCVLCPVSWTTTNPKAFHDSKSLSRQKQKCRLHLRIQPSTRPLH